MDRRSFLKWLTATVPALALMPTETLARLVEDEEPIQVPDGLRLLRREALMNSAAYLAKADAVRAHALMLEGVPGSGYHDGDRDANGELRAPQNRGFCRASENLIGFFDGRDVHFVGDDALRALRLIEQHVAKLQKRSTESLSGTDRKLIDMMTLGRNFTTGKSEDGIEYLSLWLSAWSDFLAALEAEKVKVSPVTVDRDGASVLFDGVPVTPSPSPQSSATP